MPEASGSIAYLGAARFQGFWNASTNEATGSGLAGTKTPFGSGVVNELFATGTSPAGGGYAMKGVVDASGNGLTASAGHYWQVTGSGTHNVDGQTNWNLNDWVIYSGSHGTTDGTWKKLAFEDTIASIIMGDLSASDVFHLSGSNDKHVLFVSGTSDHTVNMSGSNNFVIDYNTGSASNRMRVGIGGATGYGSTNVLNPMNVLQVSHTGGDSDDGILIVRSDSSTADGDLLGGIGFDSTDGNVPSTVTEASAFIAAYAAEDHASGDKGADLVFGTSKIDDNEDTTSTEHVRILDSGKVGVGTSAPSTLLHVSGTLAELMVNSGAGIVISGSNADASDTILKIKNNSAFGPTGGGHYISGISAQSNNSSFQLGQNTDGAGRLRLFDASGSLGLSFTGGGPAGDGGMLFVMNKGNPSDFGVLYFDGSQRPVPGDEYLHLSGSDQGLVLSGTSVAFDGLLQGSDVGAGSAAGIRSPLLLSEVSGTNAYFGNNAFVFGNLGVTGSTTVAGHLSGATAYFNSNAFVFGDLGVTGSATVAGHLSGTTAYLNSNAFVFGNLGVTGSATVAGNLDVAQDIRRKDGTDDYIRLSDASNSLYLSDKAVYSIALTTAGTGTINLNSGQNDVDFIHYPNSFVGGFNRPSIIISGSDGIIHSHYGFHLHDDQKLYLGDGNDAHIEYNEDGDDYLIISGSTNGLVLSGSNIVIAGTLQGASPLVISGSEASASCIISGTCEVSGTLSVSGSTIYNYGDYYNYRPNNILQFHIDSSNQRVTVHDDQKLTFGSNNDAHIEYDEDQTNYLIISGSVLGTVISGSNVKLDASTAVTLNTPAVVIGQASAVDPILYFTGDSNTGYLQWLEDEDRFALPDDMVLYDDEKFYFGTALESYIGYRETGDDFMVISGSTNGVVLSGSAIVLDGATSMSDLGLAGHLSGTTAYFNSNAFVFGDLGVTGSATVAGDITVGDKIIRKDDADTYMDFGVNSLNFIMGGLHSTTLSTAAVMTNVNRYDIDFNHWVTGTVGTWPTLHSDAALGRVGVGTSTPSAKLDVSGSTKIGRNDGMTSTHQITGSAYLTDNSKFVFGENDDAHIEYNEDGDDYLIISGSTKGIVLSGSNIVIDGLLQGASPLQLGAVNITGDLTASGHYSGSTSYVSSNSFVYGNLEVTGSVTTTGAVSGSSTLNIVGASNFGPGNLTSISAAGVISGSGDSTIHKITMNQLVAATADINGGTVDGATVGASSQSSVKATTLSGSSTLNVVGASTFGPANYASISAAGVISGSGDSTIHKITMDQLVATTVDINGGAVDGTTLGASSPSSVKATTLSGSSTLNVVGASTFGPANYASISAAGIISGSGDSTIHKITMNQLVVPKALAPLEVEQSSTGGGTALLVDNDDTDQIAFAIEAANIDADVVDISADAVTTANVIDITADALTTGTALKIVSDSSNTSDRDLVLIHQDHASAVNATPLRIVQDAASCPAFHVQGPTIGGQSATASNNVNGVTVTTAMIMTQGIMATARGSGKTDTVDTAANIVAAIPNVRVGDSIDFLYSNMSGNSVTFGGEASVIMANAAQASFAIPSQNGRMFKFIVTGIAGGSESVMLIPLSDSFSLLS
tara:strand:- start:1388 stop:6190 length:4803 start_codon:yes stop_codon:yes gene_type:complete